MSAMTAAAIPDPSPDFSAIPSPGSSDPPPFVLVVDDSADMRGLIADVLGSQGFEVLTVPSAARALEAMTERLPDLVLTDLLMPGMSGFALRGLMLRRPELADIPVVVLSGYWDRPSETLDAVEVLTKPLNIDRLIEVARRVTGWTGRAAASPTDGMGR